MDASPFHPRRAFSFLLPLIPSPTLPATKWTRDTLGHYEISICNRYRAIYNRAENEEYNEVNEVTSEYLRMIDQLVLRYKCLTT